VTQALNDEVARAIRQAGDNLVGQGYTVKDATDVLAKAAINAVNVHLSPRMEAEFDARAGSGISDAYQLGFLEACACIRDLLK
jgi:hypothetical protein